MRFALLGTEADGLELARALVATGRHQLLYASARGRDRHLPVGVRNASDVEEVLADPAVEAVIVAGRLDQRAAMVRRALQSERVVLCLHPADTRPEGAYEAGMIQQDVGQVLLAVMPDAFHPAIARLHALLKEQVNLPIPGANGLLPQAERASEVRLQTAPTQPAVQVLEPPAVQPTIEDRPLALGKLRLLEAEFRSAGEALLGFEFEGAQPCFPGWDVLRTIGGEVAEVSALAEAEALEPGRPVVVSGRFEHGGLFQITLVPNSQQPSRRFRVVADLGEAELLFPLGLPGPAFLTWSQRGDQPQEVSWDAWDPWPTVVEALEAVLRREPPADAPPALSWQDAIRCLELDDGARRSVGKRRVTAMEYPEATEDVTFKGTMTLVGCAILWAMILLVILSRWVRWLGWGIPPLLLLFLGMQLFRWIIPKREPADGEKKP